ncbi:uncharacterized protein LOC123557933 [Mercenaria mercenaria]|uniref:uncharacterized protein LOC123557933 n=1 Tax=Mercenaria mercenaria TaxID=6596 RepID=UPI00234E6EB1|nr:uncharacterized protein LOC123557933 [Mercenaria mercenaria]
MLEISEVLISLIGLITVSVVLASCVKFRFRRPTRHSYIDVKRQNRQRKYELRLMKDVKQNRGTQTDPRKTSSVTVQTKICTFTERITNFGTEQINSSEIFDNCCEICVPNAEKEAVGFCKSCEKFMCLNCCKHHEKIPLSDSHTLLGKENYQKVKEKNPKISNQLVPVQRYSFEECQSTECNCRKDHSIEIFGLGNIPVSGEICCILKTNSNGWKLSYKYQDDNTGAMQDSEILRQNSRANDFCTLEHYVNRSLKDINKNAIYFTMPQATTVWKYKCDREILKNVPVNSYARYSNTNKSSTTEAFYKNGQCFGIAAFDKGLAISLFIQTSYALPDWQVQYVTFTGAVKKQIYYDNKDQPLFKEPKHLTSNDAQNVLYVSDQGANSIIALDPKGTVLFKFIHETIKCPQGLTRDDEGNIYVACDNKVIQINQHGTKSRIILSSDEAEPKMLIDVCFNKVSQKFAVVNKSAEVTVFKFLP